MTDKYLQDLDQRRSRTGCLLLSGAVVLAIIITTVWTFRRGDRTSPPAPEQSVTEKTAAAKAPPPAPARTPSKSKSTSESAASAQDPGPALLREMKSAHQEGRLVAARDIGWRILDETSHGTTRRSTEELLGEINHTLVLTRHAMPEKVDYTIQRGDTLGALARRFGTTVDLIRISNELRGDVIRVGNRLRILQATFSLEVSKTRNDLILYMNDRFFKRYHVGTGEFATTPEGVFVIEERIPRPVWWTDGRQIPFGHPDNLLGTHYLKLDVPGYGIHGTWEPESIGFQSSAGCVRLLNEEIEELYTLLPVGVQVIIKE